MCSASSKATICGFTECFIHYPGISHSIASDQGTCFTEKEMQEWADDHGIHLFFHIPHHPEATCLVEEWNDLFKTEL